MRAFFVVIQVRLQFVEGHNGIHRQGVGDQVQGIVLEIDDALAVLGFEVGFMDDIALRHVPGPDRRQGGVGLDFVGNGFRQVRTDYLQSGIHSVAGKSPVQRHNLPQDILQGRNRLHGRNPVPGAVGRFDDVSQAGAGIVLQCLDGHAEDVVALHQAALAQADGAFADDLAVEQRADGFEIQHHAALDIAHEHGDGHVVGFALHVNGRAPEFFQEAVIDARHLLAVVQEGDGFAVGQAENQDFGVPGAEFAEDGGFAEAVIRAVRGQFLGVAANGGHRVDGVEHAPGPGVCPDEFGQRAHLGGGGAHVPGRAAQEVVVESRHDERACGADDFENGLDDGLRPAFHAAGGA